MRLIRKLCTKCRASYEPTPETMLSLERFYDLPAAVKVLQRIGVLPGGPDPLRGVRFFRATGCAQCDSTGYRGRSGIFEVVEIDDDLREGIRARWDVARLRRTAQEKGIRTLAIDGLVKVILGITDLKEVMRTTV